MKIEALRFLTANKDFVKQSPGNIDKLASQAALQLFTANRNPEINKKKRSATGCSLTRHELKKLNPVQRADHQKECQHHYKVISAIRETEKRKRKRIRKSKKLTRRKNVLRTTLAEVSASALPRDLKFNYNLRRCPPRFEKSL